MVTVDVLDRAMGLPGAHRYADYVAAICPFHSDTKPSLLVHRDGYYCTACGARGKIEKLFVYADMHPLTPQTRAPQYYPSIPADMDNERLTRSAHRMLLDAPGLQQYLIGRGLERAMRRYRLGYWDGWYTVPICDEDGAVDEILFRAGPWVQGQTDNRFYQRGGQKPRMYCPDWTLVENSPLLFVTFGLFDAITLALLDYPAATSTIGKGSFKADWIAWFNGYVVILPDLGEEQQAYILASQLGWRGQVLNLPYPTHSKDPNDLLQHDPDLLQRSLDEHIRNLPNSDRLGLVRAMQRRRRRRQFAGTTL